MSDLQNFLQSSFEVKGRTVQGRVHLAPMAGLGHVAFRHHIANYAGHGLLFTEMSNARAVPNENPKVSKTFRWRGEELPYTVCQLLGSDPQIMAKAAKRVEDEGFFGVDINMGCSVAAIVKQGSGADLLRKPEKALAIVEAMRKTVDIPLFVKFRTGWEKDLTPVAKLAKQFEDAGVDGFTFHPRISPDRRSRPPIWEHIRIIKETVSIPVFGNGNVFNAADCEQMLEETGCDGISIGRIAVAKPWAFAEWSGLYTPDENTHTESATQLIHLLRHYYHDDERATALFKKIAPYIAANFTYGHQLLPKLIKATTTEQLLENVECLLGRHPQERPRPNSLMFSM
ncbi:MAG: tRNA dihydrouridine synthase [Desulfovibrio sp.]